MRKLLSMWCVTLWIAGGLLPAAENGADSQSSRPLSPEESLQRFQLHPDCRIELVAAEPDVIDPVHIAFDAEGRLWVVEYSDYPNGPQEGQAGLSRIRVLTDENGDGRYENARIFADKLLFATGLLHWKDGVIVTSAGSVQYLRDTDGDGRADDAQEWFVGFKEDNPQLRANHPTLGLDNRIYIASGLRGGEVRPGKDWAKAFGRDDAQRSTLNSQPVSLSGRDFRFDPLTGDFEAISGVGQFGLSFDDWGNRFVCDNRHPCKHIVLEDRYLKANPQVTVASVFHDVLPQGEESRLYPISRTWTTSNLHANQFTAACGLCIYRGSALPQGMSGNAFVCDPTANLVHRAVVKPQGGTFISERGRPEVEFLATKDEWCRPVNLTVGPDGALYVVDMYRAVIEHPQFMPEELKNRPDLLLGTDRGRIYRIVSAASPKERPSIKLPGAAPQPAALLQMLGDENVWQRETAQRLLLERRGELTPEMLTQAYGAAKRPQARGALLHLLATVEGLQPVSAGNRDALPQAALSDEDPRVQEQGVLLTEQVAAAGGDQRAQLISKLAAETPDSRLRFQCLLTLAALDADPGSSLAKIAAEHVNDPWMQTAVALAATKPAAIAVDLLQELSRAKDPARQSQMDLAARFVRLAARDSQGKQSAPLFEELHRLREAKALPDTLQLAVLESIFDGWRDERQNVSQLIEQMGETAQQDVQDLYRAASSQASESAREALPAIAVLEFAPWEQAETLLGVAANHQDTSVRRRALEVLGRRREPQADAALVEFFGRVSPELHATVLGAALATPQRTQMLLDRIEAGDASPRLVDAARVKQLTSHRDAAIRERSKQLFASLTPQDRQKVLADYRDSLQLKSDPLRGREVFRQQCITCHKIGDLGVNVAPDISDSRTKTPEYLLASILDPNGAIDNNYFSYTIVDIDGVVHTGVVAGETATSVTLKQPEDKTVTISREDIEEMRSNGVSLMPEGLERNITPQQMADLISFIKNWRYLDGSVPREVIR